MTTSASAAAATATEYSLHTLLAVIIFTWSGASILNGTALIFLSCLAGVAGLAKLVKFGAHSLALAIGRNLDSPPFIHPLENAIVKSKWYCQCWKLVLHCTMTMFGLWVLMDGDNSSWYFNPPSLFIPGLEEQQQQQQRSGAVRLFYMMQLSAWFYTAVSHVLWEERRKDYLVMYLHHVTTIVLLTGSWTIGATRAGIVIVFLHDLSDIPISLMQIVNFIKLEGRRGFFASELCFFTAYTSWIYFRLFRFPVYIISQCVVYCMVLQTDEKRQWLATQVTRLTLLSIVLVGMHVWWFCLLTRIAYKVITKGAHAAGEDEYEGPTQTTLDE